MFIYMEITFLGENREDTVYLFNMWISFWLNILPCSSKPHAAQAETAFLKPTKS